MKSKLVIVIVFVVIGLIIMALHLGKRYVIWQEAYTPQVLWHNNQCFIFIENRTYGWSGSYLQALGVTVKQILTVPTGPPTVIRKDLLIYHFENGKLSKYTVKNFSTGGAFFPYQGIVHYSIGGELFPAPVWRWTGSDFTRLSDNEAAEIGRSYKSESELLAREGWSKAKYTEVMFQNGEVRLRINLQQNDLTLIVRSNQDLTKKAVALKGSALKEPEEILAASDGQRKSVDQQTYLEFASSTH
jgi:hypothetical protein